MKLFSPAKINLDFRIQHRRSDGFHEIASYIQAINLFDEITLIEKEIDSFTTNDSTLPINEQNLVVKALKLFREEIKTPKFHIHLEKKIPIQAGLGGGSSNAATILWALNQITGANLTIDALMQLGAKLGSDVPFFFSTGTALCTGRGEKIESLIPRSGSGFIAKPDFGLSTPLVYSKVIVGEHAEENDLEIPAFKLEPRLKRFKEELISKGFERVFMTGSGSAFVCFGKDVQNSFVPFSFVSRSADSWY